VDKFIVNFPDLVEQKEFLSLVEKFVVRSPQPPAQVNSNSSKPVKQAGGKKEKEKEKSKEKPKEKPKAQAKETPKQSRGRPSSKGVAKTTKTAEAKSPILGSKNQAVSKVRKHLVELLKEKEASQKTSESSDKKPEDEPDMKLLEDIERLCKKPSFLGEISKESISAMSRSSFEKKISLTRWIDAGVESTVPVCVNRTEARGSCIGQGKEIDSLYGRKHFYSQRGRKKGCGRDENV